MSGPLSPLLPAPARGVILAATVAITACAMLVCRRSPSRRSSCCVLTLVVSLPVALALRLDDDAADPPDPVRGQRGAARLPRARLRAAARGRARRRGGRGGAPLQRARRDAAPRAQRRVPAADPARDGDRGGADGDRAVRRGRARSCSPTSRARDLFFAGKRLEGQDFAERARGVAGRDRRARSCRTTTAWSASSATACARRCTPASASSMLNTQPHVLYIVKPLTRELRAPGDRGLEEDDPRDQPRAQQLARADHARSSHSARHDRGPARARAPPGRDLRHDRGAHHAPEDTSSRATRASRACRGRASSAVAVAAADRGRARALPVRDRGRAAGRARLLRSRRRCSRC